MCFKRCWTTLELFGTEDEDKSGFGYTGVRKMKSYMGTPSLSGQLNQSHI